MRSTPYVSHPVSGPATVLFPLSSPFSFCSWCRDGRASECCFLSVSAPGSQRVCSETQRK
uniref:Uncharacterized protein n=1 Tax=Anguilla anguilla TaxID=7936 RepID=A0A0E9UBS7_ANGAN